MNQTILPFAVAGGVIFFAGLICAIYPLGEWLEDRVGAPLAAFGVIAAFSILAASIASVILTYVAP